MIIIIIVFFFIYTQLNVKTVLIQTTHLSISTLFRFIWTIDRTLSGSTTPSQSGPWSDGDIAVLCIPESSRITTVLHSDSLVSYPGNSLKESYPSAEMQSVYSAALVDWAKIDLKIDEQILIDLNISM